MNNILLVVLYRQTVDTSETIKSFCKSCSKYHEKISLVIWDNSPNNENNFDNLNNLRIEYKYNHTPENIALSSIYNTVISNANTNQIIHIFDQDTIIDNTYFDLIYEAVNTKPSISLFVPYVLYYGKLMSPGVYKYYKGGYSNKLKLGQVSSLNTICIASGMTVRASVYKNIQFDENLSFYGIDTKFALDYSKYYEYLFVINYSLSHNLSQFEIEPYEVKHKRFRSFVKSSRYIALNHSGIMAYLICCAVTFLKSIMFKFKFTRNYVTK